MLEVLKTAGMTNVRSFLLKEDTERQARTLKPPPCRMIAGFAGMIGAVYASRRSGWLRRRPPLKNTM
jgi:hypothetical protein